MRHAYSGSSNDFNIFIGKVNRMSHHNIGSQRSKTVKVAHRRQTMAVN